MIIFYTSLTKFDNIELQYISLPIKNSSNKKIEFFDFQIEKKILAIISNKTQEYLITLKLNC
jgi:hypothetical protein